MRLNQNLFILFFLCFGCPLSGQLYDSAAGVRIGIPLSLSYKKILQDNKAFEGYLGTRGNDDYRFTNISAAWQILQPLDLWTIEDLFYYYGGGASIYFWSYDTEGNNQSVSPGIQGYLGLEYTFPDRPYHISIDWIPSVFISGPIAGMKGGFIGVGLRYVISRPSNGGNLNE